MNRPASNTASELTTGPARADAEKRLFADLAPDVRAWALARYTPHPVAALEAPMDADDVLGSEVAGDGDPLPSRRQSAGDASAAHRGATRRRLPRAGHRPLPDAESARRADAAPARHPINRRAR